MSQEKSLILCVEDDPATQRSLGRAFARYFGEPFRVIQAMNAKEALEQFEAHKQELIAITMDGRIPGVKDTTGIVREIRKTYAGPIIAISGDITDRLVEAGCSHRLPKPIEMEVLKKFIDEILAAQPK